MKKIIRYDKVYTTSEVVLLFSGTKEVATSLEAEISRINDVLIRRKFVKNSTGPVKEEGLDLSGIPDGNLINKKIVKAYSFRLEDIVDERQRIHAYETFQAYLDAFARRNKSGGIDIENSLPVLVTAEDDDKAQAAFFDLQCRLEMLKDKYQERAYEISVYLQGFSNLAAGVKPPKYVFALKKYQSSTT